MLTFVHTANKLNKLNFYIGILVFFLETEMSSKCVEELFSIVSYVVKNIRVVLSSRQSLMQNSYRLKYLNLTRRYATKVGSYLYVRVTLLYLKLNKVGKHITISLHAFVTDQTRLRI